MSNTDDELYSEFMATDRSKKSWDLTVGLRIKAYTDKARIDEIEDLVVAQGSYPEDRQYGRGKFHHVPVDEVQDRLTQLKGDK